MMSPRSTRLSCVGFACAILVVTASAAFAQSVKVQGLIKGRNGEKMIVNTADNPNLVVILSDDTQVGQVQGVLKARRKQMSMAALIPGLAVQMEGTYDSAQQLMATSVSFKGEDLKQAQAMQAGMHEVKVEQQQHAQELAQQNAALQAQNAELQQQQAKLTEQQAQINANKAAVSEAIARFGQLDDYYIRDEVTVYFANGKITVDPKYVPQLTKLAQGAKSINGYMIEVKGFASAVGSVTLNQKLSEDRANNVTAILLQQGKVPLTRMLAPGAMGESEQVGSDKTAEGQAENRRVVVRVLQNKAVAGV
jgi:outer membrane protein OmpA-like peptidoglycan-associated protein